MMDESVLVKRISCTKYTYYVSVYGSVYSTLHNKIKKLTPIVSTTYPYPQVRISIDKNKSIAISIHRLVLSNFKPIPNMDKIKIIHIDENKTNYCLFNLDWLVHKSLSLTDLKKCLNYNPETGDFIWVGKCNPYSRINIGDTAGNLASDGYIGISVYGKRYNAQNLAWFYMTGVWSNKIIDHINRTRNDNRWKNLREATKSQNNSNSLRNNKCGFRGISKQRGGWQVMIQHQNKQQYVGFYKTCQEAAKAYDKKAIELFGEFATLNFPEGS